jgi:cytochrome c-type biogenesis protein CcmH
MTLLIIFSALIIAVTAALVSPLLHKKGYAAAIMLLLPVLAFGLYIMLGNPALPGKPYADRSNDPDFILDTTVKQIQLKLEKSPSQEGYRNLAEALYLLQRYAAAAEAYKKAIALGDKSAETLAEMGESIVLANNGTVVPEALGDFHKALKRDPKEARARFYIALGNAQARKYKEAVAIWKGLQKDLMPDAPWAAIINQRIQTYAREGGFDPTTIVASDP